MYASLGTSACYNNALSMVDFRMVIPYFLVGGYRLHLQGSRFLTFQPIGTSSLVQQYITDVKPTVPVLTMHCHTNVDIGYEFHYSVQ
jgi:hypothetical protein